MRDVTTALKVLEHTRTYAVRVRRPAVGIRVRTFEDWETLK